MVIVEVAVMAVVALPMVMGRLSLVPLDGDGGRPSPAAGAAASSVRGVEATTAALWQRRC
jgi:hypothetical protein